MTAKTLQSRNDLDAAKSIWEAVAFLLRCWQNRPRSHSSAHDSNDDEAYERWDDLKADARAHFSGRSDGALSNADRQQIERWTSGGSDWDAVDAIAWGIDEGAWPTFTDSWRSTLSLSPDSGYLLQAEDFYPVCDMEPSLLRGMNVVSLPGSLTKPRDNELPHVRRHDGSIEVVFRFGLANQLEAVAANLSLVAAIHPNQEWDFNPDPLPRGLIFPVSPKNEAEQQRRVIGLVASAVGEGAQLIVAPELSTTEAIVSALEQWLDDQPGPCLVVAGSCHTGSGHDAANVAYGLLPGQRERISHHKFVPWGDEHASSRVACGVRSVPGGPESRPLTHGRVCEPNAAIRAPWVTRRLQHPLAEASRPPHQKDGLYMLDWLSCKLV